MIATEEPCLSAPTASPPSSLPADTIWVDDQVPAGATTQGIWNWDTTQKASGNQSHTEPAASGMHQHYFTGATQTLSPVAGEILVCYVLINPCNPPQEIMLQWYENGSWEHRAYWGANAIAWGTNGTASRYPIGPLPEAGRWVRLEVPTSSVGLANKVITGMAFTLYGGHAWFDRAGKGESQCQVPVASPPASFPLDTVWVDDQVPAGATTQGIWNWDTTQKASGTQSHTEPALAGLHQHSFTGATQTLSIAPGDSLICYVLLNPCDPPQEIMLEWQDSFNSWHHRAYWGQNLVYPGINGTASRYPMGPLPQSGEWVRLEVPATNVDLAGKVIKGMAFTLYGGQAWFDRAGKGCPVFISPPPSTLPPDTVWMDDQPPAGAVLQGIWNWDTAQKVSGLQSHTEPGASGTHQHSFTGATQTLSVASGDKLVSYVLINPCDPPQEIMLQWYENGSWEHRAYWGANLIAWGINGTASRYPMGTLPPSGAWVRLEVPSSIVGLGGKTVTGMAFTLYGGQAWFDRTGKSICQTPIASTPPAVPYETLWVDDQVPAGATTQGIWNWDTTQKASGTQSHTEPAASGMHQHYFTGATQTLSVAVGDKLFCYVLINPCDPPQEIMLQWYENGSWEHRAYWGENLITWGTNGTASRYPAGSLPQAGAWIKLEVPASAVGLEGKTVTGMAFTLYGGKVWFDRAGKSP